MPELSCEGTDQSKNKETLRHRQNNANIGAKNRSGTPSSGMVSPPTDMAEKETAAPKSFTETEALTT